MKWLLEMIDQPAFTNPADFEMQVRRNMLIPEAEAMRDEMAEPKPILADKGSAIQVKCHKEALREWEDQNDVLFFKAMKKLYDDKYGGA